MKARLIVGKSEITQERKAQQFLGSLNVGHRGSCLSAPTSDEGFYRLAKLAAKASHNSSGKGRR